ncbi:MAG: glucose-6-phosphate isomerase family protein [Candidatus Zipacnadales bacterium]
MIDLLGISGLPLALHEAHPKLPLWLAGKLQPGQLEERRLAELRKTLANPAAEGPDPAYYMYRGVARFSAVEGDVQYNWRYDVTVFPAGRYGDEYLRTVGHYHPPLKGRNSFYPEVYEVLSGTALFILQRVTNYEAPARETQLDDLILLHAEAGEKAMMLPGYGHWTVNVTPQPLVVSNWICADFSSHYASVIAARGPCCYVVVGTDGPRLARNPNYAHPPSVVRHARPVPVPRLGLVPGRPMFHELHRHPDRWRYLCDPVTAAVALDTALTIDRTEPFPFASITPPS